jgi:subtilase family serine protease
MLRKWCRLIRCFSLATTLGSAAHAALTTLPGHVPREIAHLPPTGRLAAKTTLELAIGLPLRNQPALNTFLRDLYDPAAKNYHRYLTPEQFTAQFGPTVQAYQTVVDFARTNGLTVTRTHGNRVLLDVSGAASDIEKTFHITLRTYRHPTENRNFFAPDTEPTVATGLPILDVSGLSDYAKPTPMLHHQPAAGRGQPAAGSGPRNAFIGRDFRNAYVPGTTLDGSGQRVGLLELSGYNTSDITAYETQAGLPSVPLQNIFLDGATGAVDSGNDEVCLDIELTIAMATNLASVVVFEAPNGAANLNDIFNAMASSNQIHQFSCSWGFGGGPSQTTDQIFQQMAAEGQSFFQASGDGDAWTNPIWQPGDNPYITVAGGTTLAMSGAGSGYLSETVWNSGYLGAASAWGPNGNGYWGSGGGVSANYSIPAWQTNLNMTANLGSTTMRNIPDVAMTADNVYATYDGGSSDTFMGTSCAAPLWAGFMALVNEQAAILEGPPVGFINPAIYALANTTNYTTCFNDITMGNNTSSNSPSQYFAVPGYDLCTGLGTPAGTNLIAALTATTTVNNQQLVRDGGFETGYFTDWILYGDTIVIGPRGGAEIYDAVETPDDPNNSFDVAHSGTYGAFLGDSSLAILAQTLSTVPGQEYLLSFWLNNPQGGADQQFLVNWNTNGASATNTIYFWNNGVAFAWTNFNYVLAATSTNTTLQFGAANPPNYFGLDDVSVTVIPPPSFGGVTRSGNGPAFTWSTLANVSYLVQYQTNLTQTNWLNLGSSILAASNTLTVLDTNALVNSPQRFYRIQVTH